MPARRGSIAPRPQRSFKDWLQRVLEKAEEVEKGFDPDAVHDLRVAVRHSRAVARSIEPLDNGAKWGKMGRAAKKLLDAVGDLRDAHVIKKTVARVGMKQSVSGESVIADMGQREKKAKRRARKTLQSFDRKRWRDWMHELPDRAARVRPDGLVAELLVLDQWNDAWARHQSAMKSRSRVEIHKLRIGIKRLRYAAESFLPERYRKWAKALQKLQDLLGDAHDMDVLRQELAELRPAPSKAERKQWASKIQEHRAPKLLEYRRLKGKWDAWRAELPQRERLDQARAEWLAVWAAFLDPDPNASSRVARIALSIFDGLDAAGLAATHMDCGRGLLEAAAFTRHVASSPGKHHRKATYKMILRHDPPPGWTSGDMEIIAQIARLHHGELPDRKGGFRARIAREHSGEILLLAGILRLASALGWRDDPPVTQLKVKSRDGSVIFLATGYREVEPIASHVASARHLLELELNRPILVEPAPGQTLS
jgi:CHAD domain-containing protein